MADPLPTILGCASESWKLISLSQSGPRTIAGTQQVVASPSGYWQAKAHFNLIEDEDYLEAQGWLDSLDGMAGTFLIGPSSWRGRPWNADPLTGGLITPDRAKQDHDIDPAYDGNPDTTGRMDFRLAADAAMNATTISVQRNKGGLLKRGQYLSIGERLHRIVSVPVDDGSAGVISLTIRPWLRAAYASGQVVEFNNPVCLMRLASADTGAIEITATTPLADFSLDLVEAF